MRIPVYFIQNTPGKNVNEKTNFELCEKKKYFITLLLVNLVN